MRNTRIKLNKQVLKDDPSVLNGLKKFAPANTGSNHGMLNLPLNLHPVHPCKQLKEAFVSLVYLYTLIVLKKFASAYTGAQCGSCPVLTRVQCIPRHLTQGRSPLCLGYFYTNTTGIFKHR